MADCIRLREIVCYGYSGVYAEERRLGQRFIVDADLHIDLRTAGGSDRLEDSLDYGALVTAVRQIVEERQFSLLEALAEAIARRLRQDARVQQVRVVVAKPQPPIPGFTGSVAVEIWR
ncbi:dihydroneopterin aldolase [Gloeobacter violaceus]|uniref:7,8-dihydroneopterin aldolase n=1 Tax=Gloeobacter violaceus (strain ATCC 29082 / PCC 7421) TaxID=251221 RepID=Q7NKJ0_GLOVI|nr:dihydroneopterin aldolase [Gloeobacter violaceus]BAC89428.1 dihydroneopterin aldolase [Gloeobacter violaceus PCC 7421]